MQEQCSKRETRPYSDGASYLDNVKKGSPTVRDTMDVLESNIGELIEMSHMLIEEIGPILRYDEWDEAVHDSQLDVPSDDCDITKHMNKMITDIRDHKDYLSRIKQRIAV